MGVGSGIAPSRELRSMKGENASGSCWDDDDDDDLTAVGMDMRQMKTMKYETDVLLRGLVLVNKI